MSKTTIRILYGPSKWFQEVVMMQPHESFMEAVELSDEERRVHLHRAEGSEPVERFVPDRPERLVAESGDYASVSQGAITNFPEVVQRLAPRELILQNPPIHVHRHLERTYRGDDTPIVEFFEYPTVSRQTLKDFAATFEQRMIGQTEVKRALLAALYPLTRDANKRPVVVMFYGPSGTGKTETAKLLNDLLGGDLMRKQFSMYQNERFASYVFGGSHTEPSFAQDLLDRDSGVILLDEFDKANPVFHSAFYELFDDGIYEDRNYRAELGPALIICTSNYASERDVQQALGDALFSRFDALIGFEALSPEELALVVDRTVTDHLDRLDESERALLDADEIKHRLTKIATRSANIRKLSKLTEQYIHHLLVTEILNKNPEEEPS